MSFTVASYNVQIPLAKAIEFPWGTRKSELLANISQLADVLCLQEVSYEDEAQGYEISEVLEYCKYVGFEPSKRQELIYPDVFHQRLPIFWRSDLFEQCEEGHVMLLTTGTAEQQMKNPYLENRYCSLVLLEEKVTKRKFYAGNVHLQHVPIGLENVPVYRETQLLGLQVLQQYITDVNIENLPAIIAGDYNMVDADLAGFSDTMQKADHVFGVGFSSYHGYSVEPMKGGNIDHVLVNSKTAVAKHELLTNVSGSDHFPVKVEVTLLD